MVSGLLGGRRSYFKWSPTSPFMVCHESGAFVLEETHVGTISCSITTAHLMR
ncbi:hypothetical protein M3J09_007497 [Ascochyta lentis]